MAMFIEKVKSAGLAHLSYIVGAGSEAAVIDPRRDCDVYVDIARRHGCRITHIFETHRNEDLVSGTPVLAEMTGAAAHHGPNADGDVTYADTVPDGAEFNFDNLRLRVMETPGHTFDSLSFAVYDSDFGDGAVGVFTGDALFVGDVGRTDFYPDRAREVAGLLYDSLQDILSLGDQAIIYPAHGAGSVCGDNMADREFSTVGHERVNNPMLQIRDRDEFIDRKVSEHHEQPPYFRRMEKLNLEGGSPVRRIVVPPALPPGRFVDEMSDAVIVDVRGVTSYLGAHLADSFAIPDDMVPAFAGWFLDPDDRIILVADDETQAETAARHLARIGYDNVDGFLTAALTGWAAGGHAFKSTPVVDVETVAERVDKAASDWCLLDVRDLAEYESGAIRDTKHIYVGHLPDEVDSLDPECHYTVMCASGARATIASSVLRRAGIDNVDVFLGSMGAWQTAGHPTE